MNAPSGEPAFDLRARRDLAAAALLFSTGGAAIKLADANGWQVAGLRSLIAATLLWLTLPRARGPWNARILAVATSYAGTLTAFVLSTKATTAANAIFLQSTAPLYVLALSPLLLRERIRAADGWIAALFGLGLIAIMWGQYQPQASAPNPTLGNGLGALSGLLWGITLMGLRWLTRNPSDSGGDATRAVIAGSVITFAICAPMMASGVADMSFRDLMIIAGLGVFQVALPYAFLTRGIARVPAFSASLIILIEPALNPIWSWLVHKETVDIAAIVGGIIILTASLAKSANERRRSKDARNNE